MANRQIPDAAGGNIARRLHGLVALACWLALILQYRLITDMLGTGLGSWRFFGYFTIVTNIAVATVSTALYVKPSAMLASPTVRHAILCAIIIVGLTYSFALRSVWNPTGWQKLADFVLHGLSPLLYAMAWLSAPHPGLHWRALATALILPLIYLAYAIARGALDGWYAYWFLDPHRLSAGEMTISIALLLTAFPIVGAIAVLIDRALAKRRIFKKS